MRRLKLRIPLTAKAVVQNYQQHVKVFTNGQKYTVLAPFEPFIYTDFDIDTAPTAVQNIFIKPVKEAVRVRPSHKQSAEDWFKYTFQNEIGVKYLAKQLRESASRTDADAATVAEMLGGSKLHTSGIQENYINQILAAQPKWFEQFAQTEHLKIMVLDIEQLSNGQGFAETRKNTLISIGCQLIQGDKSEFKYWDIKGVTDASGKDDKEILRAWVATFKDFDPDIIVGFNICGYDLPTICYRLERNGFKTSFFDREGLEEKPYFYRKEIGVNEMDVCKMGGRVVYDVFHAVMADQTLNGKVKNRRLKTIAKYFQKSGIIPKDIEIVEEKMNDNSALVGTEKLRTYNASDVRITSLIFDMYFKNTVAVAEFISCPLEKVVPLATSYPFTVICSQIFHENGMVSAGKNLDRNRQFWSQAGVGKPYQGANVACFKRGRFENVYEYDKSSMYPYIVASLGIGPDNTRIIKMEPYNPVLQANQIGDRKIYYVPDTERNCRWVIEVTGYSAVAQRVKDMLELRIQLKNLSTTLKHYIVALKNGKRPLELEMKLEPHLWGDIAACESLEAESFIRAYGLKVVLNSLYGLFGSAANSYGELGAAALITGVGRQLLQNGVKFLGEDNCICIDTDGLKSILDVSLADMNAMADKYVVEQLYGLPLIHFEKEHYPAMFSREMKTYLLLNAKGEMEVHGVGFKSSRKAPVVDRIINEIGPQMLKHGHAATKKLAMKYYDLKELPRESFVMEMKLGKSIDSYAPGALSRKLAEMYKSQLSQVIRVGDSMSYIKTTKGYEPDTPYAFNRLDEKYYLKAIDEAVQSLGYSNPFMRTLGEWM